MVEYNLLSNNMTAEQLFAYPTTGDIYFYVIFLLAFVIIISSLLYKREVDRRGEANYLSSLAVSCFVGIVLTFTGSLFGLFDIEKTILLFVIQIIPIAIWWFTGD